MRILILNNSSWNVVNFRSNLVKKIIQDGHEVVVMANRDQYSPLLGKLGCKYKEITFQSRSLNPFAELKLFFNILLQVKAIKPDFILTFTIKPNIYGSLVAKILKIRTINNIAGLGIAHSSFLLRNFVKYLYKFSLKNTYKCFFQNVDDLSYFVDQRIVSKLKTSLLPGSGVDLERFYAAESVIRDRRDSSEFNFLLSSRMLWSKGIREYILAAKRIKAEFNHVNFWLVGFVNVDNRDAISLSDITKWNDEGAIVFKGSTDDIKSVLESVHCFVLPTYYPEGTPKSLLEASAMQLPIITTDSSGCRDVVKDGVTGYLCKQKDHKDLYEKMKIIVCLSNAERETMGYLARETMKEKFDDRIVSGEYLYQLNKS